MDQCLHCGRCLSSDVGSANACTADQITPFAVLVPLVKAIASAPELSYAVDATSAFVHWLIDQPQGRHKAHECEDDGQPLIPYRYTKIRRPVPFSTCMRVAARFQLDLHRYLGGTIVDWSMAVYADENLSLPALPDNFSPSSPLTASELSSRIQALRMDRDMENPMTLSLVAATLGITIDDIVYLSPNLAQEIYCIDVVREIWRRNHQYNSERTEYYRRLGRESSNNPRVQVTALLERDFPDLDPTIIESVVDDALASCWSRSPP